MNRADLYALLALAAIIGAIVATIVAWWYVDQARRTALAKAAERHKLDKANIAAAHQQELAKMRQAFANQYAEWAANRDNLVREWQAACARAASLEECLVDEQARLDQANWDLAAARGVIADLENTVGAYERAWGDVEPAFRTSVVELERISHDDVWAPPLDPTPALVEQLALAVEGKAAGLPDEWEPESFTQWFAKIKAPTTQAPNPRKRKNRRAVAR